jgi:hypothetical protein
MAGIKMKLAPFVSMNSVFLWGNFHGKKINIFSLSIWLRDCRSLSSQGI